MAVKWKWNNNTGGGNVPAGLENRVQTLETNAVKITGDQSIAGVKTFTGGVVSRASTELGTEIKAGYGGTEVYITPEDTSTKTIKYGRSGSGRFNIDLENQSQLMGIKDPTADYHAVNKKYVDNRIKFRTVNTNINASATYNVEPTSGYQVINVMVARKRSNDGLYFFEYQTTLNKQVFWGSDNKFKVYNQGNVSGFSNTEFKLVILEMKV